MENLSDSLKNKLPNQPNDFIDELWDSLMSSYDTLKENQAANQAILKKNYEHVGKIISCHLMIENLINNELVNLGLYSKEKLKGKNSPRFAYKLSKLPKKNYLYVFLLAGIKQLNNIRNAFAHNLEVEITEEETSHIDKIVQLSKGKKTTTMSLEEKIEQFTVFCIGVFGTRDNNVRKPFLDLRAKYPKFDEFIKKTAKKNGNEPDERIYV